MHKLPVKSRWKKGQSGNPSGKSKAEVDLQQSARAHAPLAMTALLRVLRNKKTPAAATIAAAQVLWDRGYGKPTQPVTGDLGFAGLLEVLERRRQRPGG